LEGRSYGDESWERGWGEPATARGSQQLRKRMAQLKPPRAVAQKRKERDTSEGKRDLLVGEEGMKQSERGRPRQPSFTLNRSRSEEEDGTPLKRGVANGCASDESRENSKEEGCSRAVATVTP